MNPRFGFYSASPQGQAAYKQGTSNPPMDPLMAALNALKQQMSLQPPPGPGNVMGAEGADAWKKAHPTTPGTPQFDPSVSFNQPATPGLLPQLNTGGVNPYLNDPLMSSYYRLQNPMYGGQGEQSFYGDPELFNAPTATGAL